MVKVQRLFAKTNLKIPVFETGKSEAEGDRLLRTYENKDELKNEINKSFAKYISEFNDIPEHLKDKRVDEIDRTPAENLAYQVGWTTLVIKWESDERKGIPVKTPSDNFKWNQLGELYQDPRTKILLCFPKLNTCLLYTSLRLHPSQKLPQITGPVPH